jgi:hypothetical protein
MVPMYLVITASGGIYLTQSIPDAVAVAASPALRVQLNPSVHTGAAAKIAQISGNSPSYTVTATAAGEFGNQHARSL